MKELLDFITQLAGGNQVLTGVIGAWGLGVGTWLLRNVPLRILNRIKVALIGSMTIDSVEGEHNSSNDDTLEMVTTWLLRNGWSPTLRNFRLTRRRKISLTGGSTIWFFYRKRLMWATPASMMMQSTVKHTFTISTFCLGNVNKVLNDWFTDVRYTDPAPDGFVTGVVISGDRYGSSYETSTIMPKRELETLPVDEEIKARLLNAVGGLLANDSWYVKNRMPRKLVILASGVPGCGKTSLGLAIANHFDLPIHLITQSAFTPSILRHSISCAGGKDRPLFLMIDDIDCNETLMDRALTKEKSGGIEISGRGASSLADYLAVFGGAEPMDNVVFFMTTNHPEKLDPAFRRAGRIDITLEMGGTKPQQQYEFALQRWPELAGRITPEFFTEECTAADLFGILAEARWDSELAFQKLCELTNRTWPEFEFHPALEAPKAVHYATVE